YASRTARHRESAARDPRYESAGRRHRCHRRRDGRYEGGEPPVPDRHGGTAHGGAGDRVRGVRGCRAVDGLARGRAVAVRDGQRSAGGTRGCGAPARLPRGANGGVMPVPILKQGDTLIASVITALTDED